MWCLQGPFVTGSFRRRTEEFSLFSEPLVLIAEETGEGADSGVGQTWVEIPAPLPPGCPSWSAPSLGTSAVVPMKVEMVPEFSSLVSVRMK